MKAALKFVYGCGTLFYRMLNGVESFLRHIRSISLLIIQTLARVPLLFKNFSISIEQMYAIGVESVPLVSVIALFAGAVSVTQAVYQFSGLIPMKYLGLAVCKMILLEIGPVFISLVVASRIATAIAAEIGSMKTSEQLDAMVLLRLDPLRYLIVPKTVACMIMLPVLVIWGELLAILGSIVTVLLTVKVTMYVYLSGLKMLFNPGDLFLGIFKSFVFGGIIAMTGAYFGFQARGGAEGVGEATTKAVMTSAILILIFDFVIAFLVL